MDEISDIMNAQIDAYVDGQLEGDELVAFESAMDTDDRIRAEVDRLRSVDDNLNDVFGSLKTTNIDSGIEPRLSVRSSGFKNVFIPMGLAAAVLLAAGLFSLRWTGNSNQMPAIDGSVVLTAFLSDPIPAVVCDTEPKFVSYTTRTLGQAITARFDTGVALIGWRGVGVYDAEDMNAPRVLMARGTRGEAAVVVFQRADMAAPVVIGARPGMHMHQRRFGSVDAWEFSQSDSPIVLEVLTLVD